MDFCFLFSVFDKKSKANKVKLILHLLKKKRQENNNAAFHLKQM